ncbi:XkdX family protein [Brevibacillus sp. HB1.2]|nr:XkdX family protein [Brevibacillus sp. HB1.2]NTU22319.1 XkdX family protein [Brevibacillus sp. HB1.2]
MTDFQKWKYYYDRGWANAAQLKQVVSFNKITAEEFKTITGQSYTR